MVDVRDLEFRYPAGTFALRIPELQVGRATRTAVIGASGTGKTTLLHLISGVSVPMRGRIEVDGVEISGLSDAQRRRFRVTRIGMVFQEFELLEYLSVIDNILLPYRISGALTLTAEVKDRARALAERVGLADKLRRNVTKLSQGERQRVGICRALVTRPTLLVADEPTGNLDPANRERVTELLLEYSGESHTTLLTVTHDHGQLARYDRVINLEQFQPTAQAAS